MATTLDWKTLAAQKKARQLTSVPKEWLDRLSSNLPAQTQLNVTSYPGICGLLDGRELNITNSDVETLLLKLSSGEWTAVEVTTAFCKRAIVAQQLTNCLTEIFIDRALARAVQLDEYYQKTGKVVGSLHGLPVSLKDQVDIKGLESTIGYVSYINRFADRNAVLVEILEAEGAVLYVKSNIPQTLMWPETFNHIFGRTVNPHNRSLTCGGSSGGEGALVALKGSPLGVGSDIGGSVRIPSACCGIYGLRPSTGRVPYSGCANSLEGQDSLLSVLGPMSNSVAGLKIFMKAIIDAKPWTKDPLAACKRWSEEEYQLADHGGGKQLCFAVLWDDGVVAPHPPILRGLEMTKKALISAGHRVIDWVPFKHEEIYESALSIYNAGAKEDFDVVTGVSGEPLISTMYPDTAQTPGVHDFLRPSLDGISAYQLWQAQKKRKLLREEYLWHWQGTEKTTGTGRPVDAILSPVAPATAPPHGTTKNANYTMIFNALDYTALVIPVSRVDQKLDIQRKRQTFFNDTDKAHHESYNPATFADAPITIQLVGRTMQEEAVLRMSEIVDSALKTFGEPASKL
ncbi:general amidase [Marasmius fiardii PR-910]|nr:general amidase [Marasmius fiardii PR-910]